MQTFNNYKKKKKNTKYSDNYLAIPFSLDRSKIAEYFASQPLVFERERTDLNSSQVRRLIKAGNIARTV